MDLDFIDHSPTFRLFSLPSTLEGFGSVINLAGVSRRYRVNATPAEADLASLRADWRAVAADLRAGLRRVRKEAGIIG